MKPALSFMVLLMGTNLSHAQNVPPPFQQLYTDLDREIDQFTAKLDRISPPSRDAHLTYGVELRIADCHIGPSLLTPRAFANTALYLDRMHELGVQGIKISLFYPCLVSTFPRYEEYLAFYRRVAQQIRSRGMKLAINVNARFNNRNIAAIPYDYTTGLTIAKYNEGKREQVQIILRELKPDYLTVANEPTTEASNTGLHGLATVEGFTQHVRFVLQGLETGSSMVGAGVGTWSPPEFVARLVQIPGLQMIDLHIYPLQGPRGDYLDSALHMAEIARANHKKLISTEMWLYKAAPNELGHSVAATPEIFKRDVYSFWEPLDGKFLTAMSEFANRMQFDFITAFFGELFFAHLDYTDATADMLPNQTKPAVNAKAFQNIQADRFTPTARKYQELIAGH